MGTYAKIYTVSSQVTVNFYRHLESLCNVRQYCFLYFLKFANRTLSAMPNAFAKQIGRLWRVLGQDKTKPWVRLAMSNVLSQVITM